MLQIVEFDTPWNLIQRENGYFRGMCLKSGTFGELEAAAKAKAERSSKWRVDRLLWSPAVFTYHIYLKYLFVLSSQNVNASQDISREPKHKASDERIIQEWQMPDSWFGYCCPHVTSSPWLLTQLLPWIQIPDLYPPSPKFHSVQFLAISLGPSIAIIYTRPEQFEAESSGLDSFDLVSNPSPHGFETTFDSHCTRPHFIYVETTFRSISETKPFAFQYTSRLRKLSTAWLDYSFVFSFPAFPTSRVRSPHSFIEVVSSLLVRGTTSHDFDTTITFTTTKYLRPISTNYMWLMDVNVNITIASSRDMSGLLPSLPKAFLYNIFILMPPGHSRPPPHFPARIYPPDRVCL